MPPPKLNSCEPQDIGEIPNGTKQILFKYDCDCVLLFENQLEAQDARDNLAILYGIKLSPTSATSSSGNSVPATPLSHPSATTTPQTKSSSFFESICSEHFPWIFGYYENRQDASNTSMLLEANFELPKTPTPQTDTGDLRVTPNNMEISKVCSAPKKGNLTLHYVNYLKTNSTAISFMLL